MPPGDEAAGVEGYIYQLTRHLGQLDCRVHVIDIKGGEPQKEKRQESPAEFHEVWHPPLPARYESPFLQHLFSYLLGISQVLLFALLSAFPLWRLLRSEGIGVIHAHNREIALAAMLVNRLSGNTAAVVYTPQCPLGLAKLPWHKKLINFAEIPALRWADHVIALTPAVKAWLVSEFKVDPGRITPIAVGTALDDVEPFLSQAAKTTRMVFCAGGVSGRKNQLRAVKAIPQVAAAYPEVRFVFAGPISQAKYFSQIQGFIAENDLSRWVEFKGMVSKRELYELYAQADIFLFPTTTEVQPTVLMEALAFGLPVVSSTIEPIADVVNQKEGCAILVDPNDVDGLAAAVIRVLGDSSLRRSMSQKATELAQTFSFEQIAAQTLTLYEKLVQGK